MNWDFIYRGETRDLDDATRKRATSGTFIRLSDGYTHYELGGSPKGEPVVLIHGFSVPYFIWDPTFQALASLGFCVLRYDLFGRGFSDRPRVDYDINLFVRQLLDLLDGLSLSQVNLIGLSMGGAIASAFTVNSPQRVYRLALIDPIGVQPIPLNPLYRAALLPGISEILLWLAGTGKMFSGLASGVYDTKHVGQFQGQFRAQMQIKGFRRAILSTLRNKMADGFPEIYEQLAGLQVPILLLWGTDDQTLPLEQGKSLLRLIPRAEFQVIEDCGHIPHYEKPDFVNPILTRFLTPK
jgi:pimeloyl-ACP methyl ester carboxylesterase